MIEKFKTNADLAPDEVYTVLATTAQILTNENTVYKACPNKYRCKKKM